MSSEQVPIRLSLARRIDARCDRFEREWKKGERPKLEAFIVAAPVDERPDLLAALLRIELELRSRHGERPDAAQYRRRFPEQAGIIDAAFQEASRQTTTAESGDTSMSKATAAPLPIAAPTTPATIGRFQVLELLGQGAFGRVYKARDPKLERQVAIKVPLRGALNAEETERFLREAQAAASIQHPNICPVHEVGQDGENHYIVMAYVEGQSLSQMLRARKEPLPTRQAALIARKLAQALAAAHARNVVHRDLKPANIMIDKVRKDLVIMDFGLARRRRPGDASTTREGEIMGTPAYMAPEQASGQVQKIGPASDIYSLGVILYEMLAGRLPFTGNVTEVLGQVLHVEPKPPSTYRPGVDAALEAICLKAMVKDPAARHSSMKALAEALGDYLKNTPAEATLPRKPAAPDATSDAGRLADVVQKLSDERKEETRTLATQQRRHLLAGFGGLAALLIAGVIVLFLRTPTTFVQVVLDTRLAIDPRLLADGTVKYYLNNEHLPAEKLKLPIELKVGRHVLEARRGSDVLQRFVFEASSSPDGREAAIKISDQTSQMPPADATQTAKVEAEPARPAPAPEQGSGAVRFETTLKDPRTIVILDGSEFRLAELGKEVNLKAGPHRLEVKLGRWVLQSRNFGLANGQRMIIELHDPERVVAEWVLKLGGEAHVVDEQGSVQYLRKERPMPEAAFRVRHIYLGGHGNAAGSDWTMLKDLDAIETLGLEGTDFDDAGLESIKALKTLDLLALNRNPRVTDAGLAKLAGMKQLGELRVGDCSITDAGVAHMRDLTQLRLVELEGTKVTDAGLIHLKGMSKLAYLNLSRTPVTDAGLLQLHGLTKLTDLFLEGTKVTAAGQAALRAALPNCRIHGVTQATKDGWRPLFNGKDLTGWKWGGKGDNRWSVDEASQALACAGGGGFNLLWTERAFADFHLQLDFQLGSGANSGVAIRAAPDESGFSLLEIQLWDDAARPGEPSTGSLIFTPAKWVQAPTRAALKPAGSWNTLDIEARGPQIHVAVNGQETGRYDTAKIDPTVAVDRELARANLGRPSGQIGLFGQVGQLRFRNIRIHDLGSKGPQTKTSLQSSPR